MYETTSSSVYLHDKKVTNPMSLCACNVLSKQLIIGDLSVFFLDFASKIFSHGKSENHMH